MSVIYEPSGKAREYSELACNIYTGCSHKCRYCYCPAILRKSLDEWSAVPGPRKDIVRQFEREARKMVGDKREILFSFMCDPFQNEEAAAMMGEIMDIAEECRLKIKILTKNPKLTESRWEQMRRNKWWLGSTICFLSEKMREEWEPGAPTIRSRVGAIKRAHDFGIKTWLSIEPVIDPVQALCVMEALKGHVDKWKVGKLNHDKPTEERVDWSEFLDRARVALKGEDVYWKKDLLSAAAKGRVLQHT